MHARVRIRMQFIVAITSRKRVQAYTERSTEKERVMPELELHLRTLIAVCRPIYHRQWYHRLGGASCESKFEWWHVEKCTLLGSEYLAGWLFFDLDVLTVIRWFATRAGGVTFGWQSNTAPLRLAIGDWRGQVKARSAEWAVTVERTGPTQLIRADPSHDVGIGDFRQGVSKARQTVAESVLECNAKLSWTKTASIIIYLGKTVKLTGHQLI